jgi:hypothetical protein
MPNYVMLLARALYLVKVCTTTPTPLPPHLRDSNILRMKPDYKTPKDAFADSPSDLYNIIRRFDLSHVVGALRRTSCCYGDAC